MWNVFCIVSLFVKSTFCVKHSSLGLLQCIIAMLSQQFAYSLFMSVHLVYAWTWATLMVSTFHAGLTAMFFSSSLGCRIEVPSALFPSETMALFSFLFFSAYSPLFIVDLHKSDYDNHVILGCFKISSAKGIRCYLQFTLKHVLGTRSESSHILCQNITRMIVSLLANIAPP